MFRRLVVIIASAFAVCSAADNVKVVEEIAAKVNGDIITRGELARKRLEIEAEAKRQGLSGPRLQEDAGWARSRGRQDTIGLSSVIPEGAAGCRSEPATANAARNSATTSQRALRRPAASASKPMAGGPARLAK